MWNPFRKKPLLAVEAQQFQIDCYKWLLTYFGGDEFYKNTKLILPTQDFFPIRSPEHDSIALEVFEKVKEYAGMEKWPCTLEAQDEDPNLVVAPTVVLQGVEPNPLGTFQEGENNEIVITYNPSVLKNPTQMVATFAHELSHYLTGNAPEPPPGGEEFWEYATDICATFIGFGIFVANAAFTFTQYTNVDSQGWQVSRGGYLSEQEHSYALAIFLHLKGISPDLAYKHCDLNIKTYLKKAYKELENSPEIEVLRRVKYIGNDS